MDKKINKLIKKEIVRQRDGLTLIPSENYASEEVLRAMGTPLSNKYSEGYARKRYYGGNEFIDEIESVAVERAKKLFGAEHANVQPHSGSQANAAVYLALLKPGDKILGFSLANGGHLTHGSPVNFSGQMYNFAHYGVDAKTELVDLAKVEKIALEQKPKLIVVSTTSYSRKLDFEGFSKIAKKVGAYLMADIAHIAGLVIAGEHSHPFPHCDVVTSTTHKTLRGPRGGLILCKKELARLIDKGVFPGTQGGPLDNIVAAKAICFLEAMAPAFKKYQHQVILNAHAMAQEFAEQGIRVVSGGTDNHLMVLDLTDFNLDMRQVQNEMDKLGIYLNCNSIPNDPRPPFNPSGIRLGSPAITTRGFKEKDAAFLAGLIAQLLKDFENKKLRSEIKKEVEILVKKFPIYKDFRY
ncbi:MAG: serine hydroxymethyltransferase [Candidatus Portnoybacteria bacterium]|nr:serine hydroxymethyltransferase [Candidatus Portnoybacteria bacterium]MDD4982919.1 serine hydroxymethyltransferase [Candidatus Portnoybacteria bacterium]